MLAHQEVIIQAPASMLSQFQLFAFVLRKAHLHVCQCDQLNLHVRGVQ